MSEQEFYEFVKSEAKKYPHIKLARLEVWGREGSCSYKTVESKRNFLAQFDCGPSLPSGEIDAKRGQS